MAQQPDKSPLAMVVQDKRLDMILDQMDNVVKYNGEFLIPKEDVCHVREVFCSALRKGERLDGPDVEGSHITFSRGLGAMHP